MPVYTNYAFTDQLIDTTINLNAYIERYSDDRFELVLNNRQPVEATVKNIFEHSDLINQFKEKGSTFFIYYVEDGELPEDIAIKFYGSEDFWWAVILFNEIQNVMTDWPLTNTQLITLKDLYSTAEDAYSAEGYFELLSDWNEGRRKIEVLKTQHLYELITQFKSRLIDTTTPATIRL